VDLDGDGDVEVDAAVDGLERYDDRPIASQLARAAELVVRNIAEGADALDVREGRLLESVVAMLTNLIWHRQRSTVLVHVAVAVKVHVPAQIKDSPLNTACARADRGRRSCGRRR
jgi:hypothetical protein